MKRTFLILITVLMSAAGLMACSSNQQSTTPAAQAGERAALSPDYRDALPLDVQLAIGTLQLEESDLALTAEQAETLLPYWRVLQSLNQSSTAADAEINAVLKQIQSGMNGDQITAIAAMQLTEDKLQTMLDDGTLQFGFGRGLGGSSDAANSGSGRLSFGFPRGVGGGPGGGPDGFGGGPGGFGGDPGAFATRQAEMAASGENPLMAMLTTNSAGLVIRLLENKTGVAPQGGFGGLGPALAAVSELTGLSEEELGAALRDGQTLSDVLEVHNVSLDEAKQALKGALADTPLPEGQDLDTWIDSMLSGSFGRGVPGRQDGQGAPDEQT
jgi:hypothetical protein